MKEVCGGHQENLSVKKKYMKCLKLLVYSWPYNLAPPLSFFFLSLLSSALFLPFIFYFKGLVHPKMKIMSLITHPHVVPVRPPFIFGTQIKIFLMKSESSLTLHRQQNNNLFNNSSPQDLLPFWRVPRHMHTFS